VVSLIFGFQGLTFDLGRFDIALFACRALLLLYWLIFRVLYTELNFWATEQDSREGMAESTESGRTQVVNCDRLPAGP